MAIWCCASGCAPELWQVRFLSARFRHVAYNVTDKVKSTQPTDKCVLCCVMLRDRRAVRACISPKLLQTSATILFVSRTKRRAGMPPTAVVLASAPVDDSQAVQTSPASSPAPAVSKAMPSFASFRKRHAPTIKGLFARAMTSTHLFGGESFSNSRRTPSHKSLTTASTHPASTRMLSSAELNALVQSTQDEAATLRDKLATFESESHGLVMQLGHILTKKGWGPQNMLREWDRNGDGVLQRKEVSGGWRVVQLRLSSTPPPCSSAAVACADANVPCLR